MLNRWGRGLGGCLFALFRSTYATHRGCLFWHNTCLRLLSFYLVSLCLALLFPCVAFALGLHSSNFKGRGVCFPRPFVLNRFFDNVELATGFATFAGIILYPRKFDFTQFPISFFTRHKNRQIRVNSRIRIAG